MTKKQQTENLKNEFLIQMNKTVGNVLRSCETVGASRATMLRHYEKDESFRAKWDSAAKGEMIQNGNVLPSAEKLEKTRFLEPENLTKLNNSDLTKPDLLEKENLRKPYISESENSTKLHIRNDTNADQTMLTNVDTTLEKVRVSSLEKPRTFDTNSETEKASKSKRFSTATGNDTNADLKHSASIRMPVRSFSPFGESEELRRIREEVRRNREELERLRRYKRECEGRKSEAE